MDIREHFKKYPLQTSKSVYFNLWCEALDIMINKEHLTEEGLSKIREIKSTMNKGRDIE